jgi:hypothetical protein
VDLDRYPKGSSKKSILNIKKMFGYFLLTALTFYVVAFVLAVPSLGPVPSPVVKALLFTVVHIALHKMLKPHRK